jgi:hypothetical protein
MELNRSLTSSLPRLERFLNDILIDPAKIEKRKNIRIKLHTNRHIPNGLYLDSNKEYFTANVSISSNQKVYLGLVYPVALVYQRKD